MADIKVRMNFDFIDFQKVGGKVIQDRNQPDEVGLAGGPRSGSSQQCVALQFLGASRSENREPA
jgi:hypothetical protein